MTVVPLHVWPWPMSDERLALLKRAKASIHTDLSVLPMPAERGVPGRVLAFGVRPPWVCVSAHIAPENVDRVESIRGALDALLHDQTADRLRNEADWLSAVMGGPVRYSHSEDETGRIFYE